MKLTFCLSLLAVFTFTSFKPKNTPPVVKDYLNVPGPISYNNTSYKLSWSSHPANNYYKQEYLSGNEKSESYNKMMMLEVLVGTLSLKDAAHAKITELEQRKKTDATVNYQVIENPATGEIILDFIVSQSAGGKASIVEWNAYRYTTLKDNPGKKGIVLFAYSKRGYGNDITAFFSTLKKESTNDINVLSKAIVPKVTVGAE